LRFLTPTENKRLNELIGFLCLTFAILMGLALLSYNPHDTAFNVSAAAQDGQHVTRNWIGPAGSYTADLLFQIFGYAAFLLPAAMLGLGWRWLRSRTIDSQVATLLGYGLLLLSLPSLLTLMPFPPVRTAIPAGGLLGTLIAGSLRTGFNLTGAYVVAFAVFITSVFMTTSFSFAGTHAWAKSPTGPLGAVEKLGLLQKAQARWQAWREDREQRQRRRRVEENRVSGRKAAAPQSVGKAEVLNEAPSPSAWPTRPMFSPSVTKTRRTTSPTITKRRSFVVNRDIPEKPPRRLGRNQKATIATNYKLPSPSLLREGEASHKLDEEELRCGRGPLKKNAWSLISPDASRRSTPGPVVTTFEFKPEAGIKYSRIIGLTEDLCLALQAESILIERIPGKSTSASKCRTSIARPSRCARLSKLRNLLAHRANSLWRWAATCTAAFASQTSQRCPTC